jgi:hypothetical protein
MYKMTGLPGWMRFGFSPGWVGRNPTGLGPCASYMMTGQWPTPQAQAYWQAVQSGQSQYPSGMNMSPPPPGFQPGFAPEYSEEQELAMLKQQAQMLNQQLEQINSRIEDLEQGANE